MGKMRKGSSNCGQRQMTVTATATENQGSATLLLEVGSYNFETVADSSAGLTVGAAVALVAMTLF